MANIFIGIRYYPIMERVIYNRHLRRVFNLCISIFFVILFLSSTVVGFSNDLPTRDEKSDEITSFGNTGANISGLTIDGAKELPQNMKSWITFFEDTEDYKSFVQQYETTLEFPNLKAVVTGDQPDAEQTLFKVTYSTGYRVYQLQPEAPSPTKSPQQIKGTVQQDFINASHLYQLGFYGEGVKVGVIDTGVDIGHIAFKGKIAEFAVFRNTTYGFDIDTQDTSDVNGHGTHVASIVLGNNVTINSTSYYSGVAPNATLYSAAIDDVSNPFGRTTDLATFSAFEWMLEKKVNVINYSYGGFSRTIGKDPIEEVVNRVVQEGIIVAIAAGNSGPDYYSIGSPGTEELAITVAAANTTHPPATIAYFSSVGLSHRFHQKPDVTAPGHVIAGAYTSELAGRTTAYVQYSGTSQASPQVAGSVALIIHALKENDVLYNPGSIKAALMETAQPVKDANRFQAGAGMIDVGGTFELLKSSERDTLPHIFYVNNNATTFDTYRQQGYNGSTLTTFISLISSHPQNMTSAIFLPEGISDSDISVEVELSASERAFTQIVRVRTSFSKSLDPGNYSPKIEFFNGIDKKNVTIDYQVKEASKIVAIDLIHTSMAENSVSELSHYKETIKWGEENGIGFMELRGDAITEKSLENIDMFWISEPAGYTTFITNTSTVTSTSARYTEEEITVLKTWIDEQGGSLLITFPGSQRLQISEDYDLYIGTNVTDLNRLLTEFGIEASEGIISRDSSYYDFAVPSRINNHYTLTNVSAINYYGGSLKVEEDSYITPLLYVEAQPVSVAYERNGGRAIIAHSMFPLSDSGNNLSDIQDRYWEVDDRTFTQNVVQWLTQEIKASIAIREQDAQKILEVNFSKDGQPSDDISMFQVILEYREFGSSDKAILTTNIEKEGTGTYTVTFPDSGEGYYEVSLLQNTETLAKITYVADQAPSTFEVNIKENQEIREGDIIRITIADHGAGVALVRLGINGTTRQLDNKDGGVYEYRVLSSLENHGFQILEFMLLDYTQMQHQKQRFVLFNLGNVTDLQNSTAVNDTNQGSLNILGYSTIIISIALIASSLLVISRRRKKNLGRDKRNRH